MHDVVGAGEVRQALADRRRIALPNKLKDAGLKLGARDGLSPSRRQTSGQRRRQNEAKYQGRRQTPSDKTLLPCAANTARGTRRTRARIASLASERVSYQTHAKDNRSRTPLR